VGLFAIALYAGRADLIAHPNNVFPVAAGDLLPVVLRGLLVASMLAAVMSSLDGMMINFSGMMVNNFYREYLVRQGSPKHYFRAARTFAVVGVLAGWWVATTVTSLIDFATFMEPFNSLTGVAIMVALLWRRTTRTGAIASVLVMFPLFFILNRTELIEGLASLPWGIRHACDWLVDLYASLGHAVPIPTGEGAHLPVQIKNPLYLIPGLVTIVFVSLLTRQHNKREVDLFYARLDTPLGEEGELRRAGFREDDLEGLDREVITVEAQDHDASRRLLLPDLLRLPWLLKRGEAKLSDYKWDFIGVVASVAFVILFIMGVNWLGSLF
jgi:Na+/proline symporter